MQITRSNTIRPSSDVISGILNCVCPDCRRSMGGAGKRSSANASVRGTGVRSGSRVLRVLHVDGRGWAWYMSAGRSETVGIELHVSARRVLN